MLNRIVVSLLGIGIMMPLFISIPYIIKIIIESRRKDRRKKFYLKVVFVVILFSMVGFLIYFITMKFIIVDVEVPLFLNVLGMVLFPLYYCLSFGFIHSLGLLGHGGVSPRKVLYELYNEFIVKSKRNGDGPR